MLGDDKISKKKVFSIIVLNYNNFELLFQMIDTIYNQTYENIELIIMDDASDYFDKEKVLEYVNSKRNNIKIKIVVNKENIGTVKTINKSLKYATGDYYLIAASDDAFAAGLLVMSLGCADACDVASASFTGEGDASGISTCATCIGTVLLPLKSEGITTISNAMAAAAEVIHTGHKGLV